MLKSIKTILSYFLVLLPLAGLFYNLYILPGEIIFLKDTSEYRDARVIRKMMQRVKRNVKFPKKRKIKFPS